MRLFDIGETLLQQAGDECSRLWSIVDTTNSKTEMGIENLRAAEVFLHISAKSAFSG